MNNFSKLLLAAFLIANINVAKAAIDPQQIFDKKLGSSELLMATKKTIKNPTEANLPIMVGCFMSSQIYVKNLIPSIGEKKLTSIGLPSSEEANEIFNKILDVIAIHKKGFGSESEYIAKIRPYNVDFRSYFLEDIGGNQVRPNNKKVTSWLNACSTLTYN